MISDRGAARLDGIEAVVFDFYGTLAHAPGFSVDSGLETVLATLAGLEVEVDRAAFTAGYLAAIETYWREVAARGEEQHNSEWVAAGLRACGHAAATAADPGVQRAVAAYFAHFAAEMVWLDGAEELLARLALDFPIGLLSNFTDPLPVRSLLRRDGWLERFAAVSISAEIGKRKPHRDAFEDVLQRLGTKPERTLHVGDDRLDDVFGGRQAGLRTAWIRRPDEPPLVRRFGDARASAYGAAALTAEPDFTVARVAEIATLLLGEA